MLVSLATSLYGTHKKGQRTPCATNGILCTTNSINRVLLTGLDVVIRAGQKQRIVGTVDAALFVSGVEMVRKAEKL